MITIEPGLSPWETEGRRAASAVGGRTAVVLLAQDPENAALVALGIARVQARRRRVAIADLVGGLPLLDSLAGSDATYGLSDMFHHGVSISHIVQAVPGTTNLYVLPSGPGPMDHDLVLRSSRWKTLTQGFRDGDALLLLVAPVGAPGLESLLADVDGAILVGRMGTAVPGRVVFTVPEPRPGQTVPWIPTHAHRHQPPASAWQRARARVGQPWARRPVRVAGVAAAVLVLAAAAVLLTRRERDTPPSGVRQAAAPAETVQRSAAAIAPEAAPPVLPVNPADSALAAQFAVHITSFNNQQGAQDRVVDARRVGTPAITFAPHQYDGDALWYNVIAGAYTDSTRANALIGVMRKMGTLGAGEGAEIVRRPYALRVAWGVPRDSAHVRAEAIRARGWPAYALLQADGTVSLYVGAFATPDQAARMLALMTSGDAGTTAIAFRTGRSF